MNNIAQIQAQIMSFDKANVDGIIPHRLIFSKNVKELIVLHFDLYHKNDNLFIVDGQGYALYEIKNILEIILKMIII